MLRKIKRIQDARNNIQFVVDPQVREELKPIVFFDAGKFTSTDDGFTIGYHPHSGIGIITYFHGTDLHHKDSTSENHGVIHDGGAQWIRAGGGIWHEEGYHRKSNAPKQGTWEGSIHQLWIQLPPELEESSSDYSNLSEAELTQMGNTKVLAGEYKGAKGSMNIPVPMTYLDVYLKKGEPWKFETPAGQTTGFIYTRDGDLKVAGEAMGNSEMAILEHNEGVIEVEATSDESNFIVVLAEPSKHPIVARGGQIHSNESALMRSYKKIENIGRNIR